MGFEDSQIPKAGNGTGVPSLTQLYRGKGGKPQKSVTPCYSLINPGSSAFNE
jgi:hypothetical protein